MAEALTGNQLSKALVAASIAVAHCDKPEIGRKGELALSDIIEHIEALEDLLTWADGETGCFGSEGWRHRAGING